MPKLSLALEQPNVAPVQVWVALETRFGDLQALARKDYLLPPLSIGEKTRTPLSFLSLVLLFYQGNP